jgi:aldose 1-epimerase
MTSDKPTIKNVTNHAYFNLSGDLKDSILEHELMLNADQFLPVGKSLIPFGEYWSVKGTPMDFTEPYKVGERINDNYQQLIFAGGYDHNYILNNGENGINYVGYVYEAKSGRRMDAYTSEPGVQLYTGNFMNGSHSGREGLPYKRRHALCLETQHYPDSPNQDHFPTTVLNPGEVYQSTTIYKFSIAAQK